MAYRLRPGDRSVQRAVRRIAREQIDGALDAIARKPGDQAAHDVRKACKKVRAVLRLVRSGFAGYRYENAAFRDIAGLLGGMREARVLLDTFDLLTADAPGSFDCALVLPMREHMAGAALPQARDEAAAARFEQARALLAMARERTAAWKLAEDGWDALAPGLGTVLRQARKAERAVRREPSGWRYHELRKLMKYHWYHTRLLVPLWPALMQARATELGRLADLLGLHHDICVFEERLGGLLPGTPHGREAAALRGLGAGRRQGLEGEIGPLTARLLAQDAAGLAGHWHALWDIWRAERGRQA